jgi:catechol 2,3-dioxygenase-like lactoylglutathione lyase family enzyme
VRPGLLTFFLVCVTNAGAQQRLTTDVAEDAAQAVFVYEDVEHFIDAARAIAGGSDPVEALQTKYLDRASPGLRMFIEKYDLTTNRLLKAIKSHPDEYARLAEMLKLLKTQEPSFKKTYAELEKVIPDAVFPPTYFLVAGYRGIGSGSIEGPLMSIEKEVAESIEGDLDASLVHEMVHMQQLAAVGEAYFDIFSGEERTLLALSIREGAATFFAELVAGGSEHKNLARDYLLAHEEELWAAFRKDMLGHETGDWLWQRPADPEQPQDVGYAIGARIVGTFYNNARDKQASAREIMAITDYPAFLAKSGYPDATEWRSETERQDRQSHDRQPSDRLVSSDVIAQRHAGTASDASPYRAAIWGVEMPVQDAERAVEFYTNVLGFTAVQQGSDPVVLDSDGLKLIFRRTTTNTVIGGQAHLNLNLRVKSLDEAVRVVREAGGTIVSHKPLEAAIGAYHMARDPFGNSVHLIDLHGEENDPEGPPRLYNVGLTTHELEEAEQFYVGLGFEVYSRKYLPDTLPMVPAGAAMLVIHPLGNEPASRDNPGAALVLSCASLGSAVRSLERSGFAYSEREGAAGVASGIQLRDPSGNAVLIVDPTRILDPEPQDQEAHDQPPHDTIETEHR